MGGYVILPRCLDKGRALLAGKIGEYKYNCPLDQRVLAFAGIDADDLNKQLAQGKSDAEILAWINKHSKTNPQPWAIAQWSALQESRGPGDVDSHRYFVDLLAKVSETRDDIHTWFDLLDLDDYVTFGGKA